MAKKSTTPAGAPGAPTHKSTPQFTTQKQSATKTAAASSPAHMPSRKAKQKSKQKPAKKQKTQQQQQNAQQQKKPSIPKLPATRDVVPKYSKFQQTMWNHINSMLARYVPEMKTQRRRDTATAIMQVLIKNQCVNPPEKQQFTVKDYTGMTPEQIAEKLDNSSAATLRRVNDAFIPNIPTTIALIEQGWLRIPQLTDEGYAVLKALDARTI